MSATCAQLHSLARQGTLHRFPFERSQLPRDGIYALFEAGEESHGGARIVRVGTHTGDHQLPSRLLQHFVNENKDRSIFRKNIGRALLTRASDPFLAKWEVDRTSRRARDGFHVDAAKLRAIESEVTCYLRERLPFVVFSIEDKASRLTLESRMISTLSLCEECQPSANWLGHHSPRARIRETGLWLINELFKTPLCDADIERLRAAMR
jgi:hypothetical protein